MEKNYIYLLQTNEVKNSTKAYKSPESAKRAAKAMLARRAKKFSHVSKLQKYVSDGFGRDELFFARLYTNKEDPNRPSWKTPDSYTWFHVTITRVELFN